MVNEGRPTEAIAPPVLSLLGGASLVSDVPTRGRRRVPVIAAQRRAATFRISLSQHVALRTGPQFVRFTSHNQATDAKHGGWPQLCAWRSCSCCPAQQN